MLVKLTDRNFLVGTVVTIALLGGVLGVQAWLGNRAHTTTVAVVDERATAIVQGADAAAQQRDDKGTIQPTTVPNAQDGEQAVRDGTVDALLTRGADGWRLTFHRDADGEVTQEIPSSVRENTLRVNAAAAGTTYEQLTQGTALTTGRLDGQDDANSGFRTVLGFVFAMLFYFAALTFGLQIAQSVVEEKQSRVVEILTTAIPIRSLLATLDEELSVRHPAHSLLVPVPGRYRST